MDRQSIMTSLRLAGEVRRYHTWPTLRQQSVAEHTWQVMRIWLEIWGHMPPEVSTFIMLHDTPELRTGDLPFGVKRDSPELSRLIRNMEIDAHRALSGELSFEGRLTEEQHLRIKACDLLEMLEFGAHEVHMGNQHAQGIVDAISEELVRRFERRDRDICIPVMRWANARLRELGVVSSAGMGM